jgi:hypothetical protein
MRLASFISLVCLSAASFTTFGAARAHAEEFAIVNPFSLAASVVVGVWSGAGWVFMTAGEAIQQVSVSQPTHTKYYQIRCQAYPWYFADFGIDRVGCERTAWGFYNNPALARNWGLPGAADCACYEL